MARPLSYRSELLGPLNRLIDAGECCSVVGMSGVGKSNAIQQLRRPDVLANYLGAQVEPPAFALIDSNTLPDWGPWGLFEGCLAALAAADELGPEVCAATRLLHAEVLASPGMYPLAVRRCAEALALACATRKVVLLFDEFDPLFATLPAIALRNLRGLRDRFKYRLVYVTFSRQPLTALRGDEDWDDVEPFVELLTAAELGLGPLASPDATDEAARVAGRLGVPCSALLAGRIAELSGGHPALIRALVYLAGQGRDLAAAGALLDDPMLRLECVKIWEQLSDDEQEAAHAVARGQGVPADETLLALKGIVRRTGPSELTLFSPLLSQYVHSLGSAATQTSPPLSVDLERGSVVYYGKEIGGELSELESRLIGYLWRHYGEICPLVDVAAGVYQGEQPLTEDPRPKQQADDLERLRVLARRLRQRLDRLAPDQPRLFTIIKGRGYRLGFPASPR